MSLSSDCAVCAKPIKENNEKVLCFGSCGLIMHLKCTDEIDKAGLKAMETNRGLKYMCHSCRGIQTSFNNVLGKCNEIMEKMNESVEKWEKWREEAVKKTKEVEAWKEEIDGSVKKLEENIVENMRNEFSEIMKAHAKENEQAENKKHYQMEKKIEKLLKKNSGNGAPGPSGNLRSRKHKLQRQNDNEEGRKEEMQGNEEEKQENEEEKVEEEEEEEEPVHGNSEEVDQSSPSSFADAVKNKDRQRKQQREKTNSENRSKVIIVKPKEKEQTTKVTKQELRNQIDRAANNINVVREGSDGAVILGVKPGGNVEKVLQTIREKLGEKYQATVPKPKKPRLKIIGVEDEYTETGLQHTIADQNLHLSKIELKVVTQYTNENAAGETTYCYIVEVDERSHEIMREDGQVFVGWGRCRVIECFGIIRCFKCCGYGHKSTVCKSRQTCAKCAGQHKTVECDSDNVCCANCVEINKARRLNLDVNHFAFSNECEVYKRLVARKRQYIGKDC